MRIVLGEGFEMICNGGKLKENLYSNPIPLLNKEKIKEYIELHNTNSSRCFDN